LGPFAYDTLHDSVRQPRPVGSLGVEKSSASQNTVAIAMATVMLMVPIIVGLNIIDINVLLI
jgi:hypothetical protein